jgi:hypothetical protein
MFVFVVPPVLVEGAKLCQPERLRDSRNCAQRRERRRQDVKNVEREGTKRGVLERQGNAHAVT